MARKLPSAKESVPPSLTVHRSIELLRERLAGFDRIAALSREDPEIDRWKNTTEAILHGAFGKPDGEPHQMTSKFTRDDRSIYSNVQPAVYEREHDADMLQKKAVLESCLEQLEMLAPPSVTDAEGQYKLHPEIERVSGDLYRDGHYKQAALEAYIRVIDEVKRRSALPLDGDSLMNQAFGCDNRTPVLKFNTLSTDAEKDEQKGFLFLFKGIVGLRNSKAHSNRLFSDPSRAHEYLALASLLMRVLELAS
jgi:uncharacterized protein (TIGR02391 family)